MKRSGERRRAPRVGARAEAGFEDAERQIFLPVVDVSEHGVFLLADDPPRPGSPVRVLLELPGQPELLRLPGVVARIQDAPRRGFAVEFDRRSIPERSCEVIRRFVQGVRLAQ